MAVTQKELTGFQAFAREKIDQGGAETMTQIFDLWLLENASPDQVAEDSASIDRGISDADEGRLKPTKEVFDEARKKMSGRS